MTDQKPEDPPKDLINDAEFVALIEEEMREQNASIAEDELQKKRLWQRLEADRDQAAPRVKKRPYWAWTLAAALLLGLVPWMLQNQGQEDQWKGGEADTALPANALTLTWEGGQIKASLSGASEEGRFVALVWATEPFPVLWQGSTSGQTWTIELKESRRGRVCAIIARDEVQLAQKTNIIQELREVPADAPCSEITAPPIE